MKTLQQIAAELQGYDPQSLPVEAVAAFLRELVTPVTQTQDLPLFESLDRVLAQDLVSPLDVPPHDNSAMDGYAFAGAGHGDLGAFALGRGAQALHQAQREERGVAGHGAQPGRAAGLQAAEKAGQGPGKVLRQRIGHHAHAPGLVALGMAVGVDQQGPHLRREPLERVLRERPSPEGLQAFVDAAHAQAASARQDQAGDLRGLHAQPPM